MEINGTTGSTGTQQSNPMGGVASKQLGQEEFLKLLVAQLSNQDPLNPLQGHEFAAQLAQFSSVEQLINVNKTLEDQGMMQELLARSVNNGVAAGLIGKTVEADSSSVSWKGSGSVPLRFNLDAPAANVTVALVGETGNVIREYSLANVGKGENDSLSWDGRDANGATVATGAYSVKVTATDASGEPVESTTTMTGRVDRVTFGPDGIQLWIGSLAISMSAVRSVGDSTTAP